MSHKKGFYEKYIKRPQDLLIAILAIIILSPVLVVVGVLVRIKEGKPILFVQERPGQNGKIFRLYKFRTMLPIKDNAKAHSSDAERLTTFGKKLRSTSLDELPELFNVIKNDMAIVGPRPLLVEYLDRYSPYHARRHEVKPGITGLAQIHGRNAIDWDEKLDWDVEYVDHISFLGDWKIILKTIKLVFKHVGINAEGEATVAEYLGSKTQ